MLKTKDDYRQFFIRFKRYVRYAPIITEVGMQRTNFSQFIHGDNKALSIEKLEVIRLKMQEVLKDIYSEEDSNSGQNI